MAFRCHLTTISINAVFHSVKEIQTIVCTDEDPSSTIGRDPIFMVLQGRVLVNGDWTTQRRAFGEPTSQ